MNTFVNLVTYLVSIYAPYHNFTQSLLGLCVHYIVLFLLFVCVGKLFKKLGKYSGLIFLLLGIFYILFVPKNDLTTLLRTAVLGSFIWGKDYQGNILKKELIIVPVVLAVVQFSLVSFVYTPILNTFGSNIQSHDTGALWFSMLTSIGVGIGYLIISRYLKSRVWVSDLLLAFILFFYLPLYLLNYL